MGISTLHQCQCSYLQELSIHIFTVSTSVAKSCSITSLDTLRERISEIKADKENIILNFQIRQLGLVHFL